MKAPTPRKPIITNNPRDPKLKAYKDSLSLYNKTKDIQNPKYYEKERVPSWYSWKGNRESAEKFMRKNNIDLNYEYYRTGKFPGKIQPVKVGDFGEGMAYPIYKKPTTPVIYKKPELVTSVVETPKQVVLPEVIVKGSKIPEQRVRMYPSGTVPRSTYDSVARANPSLKMNLLEYDNQTPMLGTDDSDKMKKLLKGKIPKHKFGAVLTENADAIGAGAGLASDASELLARKGKANVALKTGQGALKGIQAGASLGPPGMIAGAVIGGVTSLIGAKKQKEEMEEALNQEALERKNAAIDSSNQALADYPTNGTEGVQYYKFGGKIMKAPKFRTEGSMPNAEYEVEQGEVVQGNAQLEDGKHIATDMQVVKGEKHEDGGVGGIGGERVFSDTSKVPSFLKDILKESGVSIKGNPTYAEVAEKLGTKKGNLQKKLASGYTPSVNTAKIAGQKVEELLDTLFQIQEVTKPENQETESFRFGGELGEDSRGEIIPLTKTYKPVSKELSGLNTKIPNTILPTIGRGYQSPPTFMDKVGDFVNDNQGEIANAGSYLANLGSIKKLDTTVNRRFISAPKFNYVDRSGLAREENQRSFRTATQALGSTSRTVNASNTGALYAETLDNNNKINNAENMRRDAYVDNFNNRNDRVSAMNTQIANEASEAGRNLRNSKNVYLPQQARTAFLQGVMGNSAMKSARNLDIQKAKIIGMTQDGDKVLSRLAEREGFSSVNDYIDNLFSPRKKR